MTIRLRDAERYGCSVVTQRTYGATVTARAREWLRVGLDFSQSYRKRFEGIMGWSRCGVGSYESKYTDPLVTLTWRVVL